MVSRLKIIALAFVSVAALSVNTQLQAEDNNMQAAISACKNVTAQQRQMAKAAGYDIDAMCSAANDTGVITDTSRPVVVIPTAVKETASDKALEKVLAESNYAPNLANAKEARVVSQDLNHSIH